MNSLRQLKRIFCPIQEPHLNIPSYWQNLNVSWQLQGQGGISVQLQVKTTKNGCGVQGPQTVSLKIVSKLDGAEQQLKLLQ